MTKCLSFLLCLAFFCAPLVYAGNDGQAAHRKNMELGLKADDLNIQAQDLLLHSHELGMKASEDEFKTDQVVAGCFRKQRDVQALNLKKFDMASSASSASAGKQGRLNDMNALDTQIAEAGKAGSLCWMKMQQGRMESSHLRIESAQLRAEASKSELNAIDKFTESSKLRIEADEANLKATALDQKNQ
jgi:hypothetical protein